MKTEGEIKEDDLSAINKVLRYWALHKKNTLAECAKQCDIKDLDRTIDGWIKDHCGYMIRWLGSRGCMALAESLLRIKIIDNLCLISTAKELVEISSAFGIGTEKQEQDVEIEINKEARTSSLIK